MKRMVKAAAKRAGVNGYSSHSARKAFGQYQMDAYAGKGVAQLEKLVSYRIAMFPHLKKKYDKTLANIRNKFSNKTAAKHRVINHKELCEWLVSTDLGHGRLDVVRYYASYAGKKK